MIGRPPWRAITLGEIATALDVEHDVGAGVARQQLEREHHQQAIRGHDHAARADHADAVGIAVEGDAEIGVVLANLGDEPAQVARHRRIGRVIWESRVELAEQRHHVAAKLLQQLDRYHRGRAVAAVDNDLEPAIDQHIVAHGAQVIGVDLGLPVSALPLAEALLEDAGAQRRDPLAAQRLPGEHDLESVVLRGVVAAGDHDTALGAEVITGVVQHRGRHSADIDHVETCREQAANQVFAQHRAAGAAIGADHDGIAAALVRLAPDRPPDRAGEIGIEQLVEAADVVIAEDLGRNRHFLLGLEVDVRFGQLLEDIDLQRIGLRGRCWRRLLSRAAARLATLAAHAHDGLASCHQFGEVQRGHARSRGTLVQRGIAKALGVLAQLAPQL
jgi:hypothetical protein